MPDSKQMDEWTARFKKFIVGVWRTESVNGPIRSVSVSTYRADGGVFIVTDAVISGGMPMRAEASGTYIVDAINGEAFMLSLSLQNNWPLPQQLRVLDDNTLKLAHSNQVATRIAGPGQQGGFLGLGRSKAPQGSDVEAWGARFRQALVGSWRSPAGAITFRPDGVAQRADGTESLWHVDALTADAFLLRLDFTGGISEEMKVRMDDQAHMTAGGQTWEKTGPAPLRAVQRDAGLDDRFRRYMLGTWRHDSTQPPYRSVTTSTYNADGTYTSHGECSIPGTGPMTNDTGGTWRVHGRDDKMFILTITTEGAPGSMVMLSIKDDNTLEIPGLGDRIERVGALAGAQGSAEDLSAKMTGAWENRRVEGKVTNIERWTFTADGAFRLARTVAFGDVRTDSPVETGRFSLVPGPNGVRLSLAFANGQQRLVEGRFENDRTLLTRQNDTWRKG